MSTCNELVDIIFNRTASYLPLLSQKKRHLLFIDVVRCGKIDIVNIIIINIDIHYSNDLALREAVNYGHYRIVDLLLENGANIHAVNGEALRLAIINADYEMIQLLLKYGANVHNDNNFALSWCSFHYSNNKNYRRIMELLVKYCHVI